VLYPDYSEGIHIYQMS